MTNSHKGLQVVKLQDQIIKFNSIKVLHGICQKEKFYINMQHFISLALKLLCKTPNEAVVESIGSVFEKHMKPQRPGKQINFVNEMHIDWNGPVVSKADNILARSLDRKFGSRKKWNFKSGNTKFYTSAVVDRKKVEPSLFNIYYKKSRKLRTFVQIIQNVAFYALLWKYFGQEKLLRGNL